MNSRPIQRGQSVYAKMHNTAEILADAENEQLYKKIVDLLLAAGYYRARIQNLEPFDKILGGIVWTITGSFSEIDIEFKDDMNLQEKIKTSEKVVASLKTVNCPYVISPISIQGLDFKTLYPLLQWLVKNLLESRDLRTEMNKKLAKNHYRINVERKGKADEKDAKLKNEEIDNAYVNTKYNYINTGRVLRPTKGQTSSYNDILRIYFTLVEYGYNKDPTFQKTLVELLKKKMLIDVGKDSAQKQKVAIPNINKPGLIQDKKEEKEEIPSLSVEEQKKLDDVINANVTQVESKLQRVKTSVIEDIFNDNLDSIVSEIDKFESLKEDENVDRIKLILKEKERLENVRALTIEQIKNSELEYKHICNFTEELKKETLQISNEVETIKTNIEGNSESVKKLNERIKQEKVSEEKMIALESKFKLKEEIKTNMAKFKKDCLEEKSVFDSQLKNLEKKSERLNDSENEQIFGEIDKNYQEEVENLIKTKKELFEQNKIINLLSRKIQVFPSKLELIQYQKRFQELYEQINKISEKSRNLMNEINSREEIKKLLTQKLELFTQLKESYKVTKTKQDKENFKENLDNVLASLTESIKKSSERLKQLLKTIDESQSKLNQLQLYENNYMKLIKEYNREYIKYNRYKQ